MFSKLRYTYVHTQIHKTYTLQENEEIQKMFVHPAKHTRTYTQTQNNFFGTIIYYISANPPPKRNIQLTKETFSI